MSKQLKPLFFIAALVFFAPFSNAQNAGYTPPPMFDDMTPPMVRPETDSGYIVEPKASPNTRLPDQSNKKPVIVPRVSVDPDSSRPAGTQSVVPAPISPRPESAPTPPPVVTTKTSLPQQPLIQPSAPVAPAKMQPIIDPRDVARTKKAASPSKPKVSRAETKPPKPPQKPVVTAPKTVTVTTQEATPSPQKIDAPAVPATPVASAPINVPQETKKVEESVKADTPSQQSVPLPPAARIPSPPSVSEKTEPVKRDPSVSAIKGPKTMPALPTESVDQQKTFESKDQGGGETTILERHQKEVEGKAEETLKLVVPAPKANVTPATFDKNKQGAMKKTIPFQQGQIGLSSSEIDPIAAAIVKELDDEEKKDWRVQIRSYATPYGTGVSSDRRISLSRALSLRSALVQQGVPAARIDVMAEGLQSENAKQPDRIDLYLFGPASD